LKEAKRLAVVEEECCWRLPSINQTAAIMGHAIAGVIFIGASASVPNAPLMNAIPCLDQPVASVMLSANDQTPADILLQLGK
jgi:hypothetical protein